MRFWLNRLLWVAVAVGGCLALEALAASQPSDFLRRLILLAGLYVTLAVSLNLINGITGQFSIGHAAFYQVGAYTAGALSVYYAKAGLPAQAWLFLMMGAAALMAAFAGLVVGLPSLRLRGDYLAIVTLGFGEIIRIFAQNQQSLGGAYGMNVTPRIQHIWIVWLLAITCISVSRNLVKTAHGMPFLSVREDEVASAAMGVPVTRIKVTAFVLGSAFAGAAGAMLAYNETFVSPQMFTMDVSFIVLTMVVLGGTGSITGSAIAAVVLFYIPEGMRALGNVSVSSIAGTAVAVVLAVALLRHNIEGYHGPARTKGWRTVGFALVGVVAALIFSFLFSMIPGMRAEVDGSKLRLVVFAATLVVLMLLRPQGVFGHSEFSIDWLKSVLGFGRKTRRAEA